MLGVSQLLPPHEQIQPSFWQQNRSALIAAGAILLATIVLTLVWWIQRRPKTKAIPPLDLARQTLEPLRKSAEDGALLSQVSQVLKHYVIAAFGLPAEELTTAEFCKVIATREQIGPEIAIDMEEFLRRCDERKFAPTAQGEPLSAVSRALDLIARAEDRRTIHITPMVPKQEPAAANP